MRVTIGFERRSHDFGVTLSFWPLVWSALFRRELRIVEADMTRKLGGIS